MLQISKVLTLPSSAANMSLAYFQKRDLRQLCYLSCEPYSGKPHKVLNLKINTTFVQNFVKKNIFRNAKTKYMLLFVQCFVNLNVIKKITVINLKYEVT